ncbi:MAG: LEA type 2 family protein [Steroidobacteraceae bacterium]
MPRTAAARAIMPGAAAALLGLLGLLAGCSLLMPRLETPRLSIVSVTLERSDLLAQHLKVRMQVENPNDRALPVKGLEYTLYVEGEEAAHGVSDASFTVPALGDAQFDMDVTANMAGTLLRLLGRGGDAHGGIDYRIAGKVELSQGLLRSIPFEQHGAFSLR